MSEEWLPITSAEQLVRHFLRWDLSADDIEKRLDGNPLWQTATLEEVRACRRLLVQRRRYDAAVDHALRVGRPPTEEKLAERLGVEPRTVQRWRHGE